MVRTRGSTKKANKSTKEHASFATVVHESESPRPMQKKELVIFLNKTARERFQDNILRQNFHPEQGISLSQEQELGKQLQQTTSKLKWENFWAHPGSYSPFLVCEFYANLYDQELDFIFIRKGLIPWDAKIINELYSITINVDEHSDFFAEVTDEKRNLLQKGIVPRGDEEIMDNKGLINEAYVKRMTYGTETPILKEVRTSKIRKGKAKVDSKGTNLHTKTSLWRNLKDVEKMEESKDIEECLCKIDSLFDDGIFAGQEDTIVEKEAAATKEEIVIE
ncbi:hypothetical protein J1N35_043876 [Gossypium stocksii]|uniref:Uncharacterized protein n=1 Tax=Gossypium stocksii TaxID=47602 RepID=A0A9D3ZFD4_9ROSI|nr:hypothetical protein J1N35_043876 [Gossypium stocksii]